MEQHTYFFSRERTDGNAGMKELLGGKGANLAEMASLGIRVPPGFTITTEMCQHASAELPAHLWSEVRTRIKELETLEEKKFGGSPPLLVSVRSGAAISMPGMMDTVLNLGLNDLTVEELAAQADERFAYDAYRRLLQMFGDVVLGLDHDAFEHALEHVKQTRNLTSDTQLTAQDLKTLVLKYKKIYEQAGTHFPADPYDQLKLAILAVFRSWNNPRAHAYRQLNNITHLKGTAVTIQAMVFGNLGDDCATGVAFTRNPSTGERAFFGEILFNAQGEDVVAGIRTPQPVASLGERYPRLYEELVAIGQRLEQHYKEMQDIEFTIERGTLYMLQTRTGKRTPAAAVRIAVELAEEGVISSKTAVQRIDAEKLSQLLHPQIDPTKTYEILTKGLPASPGVATGAIVFSAADAEAAKANGKNVILVRNETSPEDIKGMAASEGILTARGGMTSHAAVVGRGMGICCIVGAEALRVNEKARQLTVGAITLQEGEIISLNGNTGEVIVGPVARIDPEMGEHFTTLLSWADELRTLNVRANAETPSDARKAIELGAEGIGLARTEHMFFAEDRISAMREFIIASTLEQRAVALAKLEPMQQQDFEEILRIMDGRPVTIRLLDPPLHEFLPTEEKDILALARTMGLSHDALTARVRALHETNPMLGHRGCRLAITYPELAAMQTRAILKAAQEVTASGIDVKLELMVPLIATREELTYVKEIIDRTADTLPGERIAYMVGTMIEIPRAALTASEIAQEAEFFSFGTNDLTQTTYGLSRDDGVKFVPEYIEKNILPADPFQTLDQQGVGRLIKIAIEDGKKTRADLKIGICGEHGGDAASVKFCHRAGFAYVSCSPYRIPIARLAAAQAAAEELQ